MIDMNIIIGQCIRKNGGDMVIKTKPSIMTSNEEDEKPESSDESVSDDD